MVYNFLLPHLASAKGDGQTVGGRMILPEHGRLCSYA